LSAPQLDSVEIMARRARMLSKMLDDLLAILAVETHKYAKEWVDMAYLTQVAITDFQASAKQANLSLVATIAPAVPKIYADAVHLRRVLDNLLGNALKFTPEGGHIAVALSGLDSRVVLEVSDTGIGIPPEQLSKIFQRFYQVDGSSKRRFGGVGLGLALVKEIVESHEGTVEVASVEGQGTAFRITLPVLIEDQPHAAAD
jgi:signal transduction histidine kinase